MSRWLSMRAAAIFSAVPRPFSTTLKRSGPAPEVLFFEATDDELVRRFSETRRRHPLVQQEGIVAAIRRERELMSETQARRHGDSRLDGAPMCTSCGRTC